MAPTKIKHAKASAVADSGDTTKVRPSDWNEDHQIAFSAALGALDALVPAADKLAYYNDATHALLTDLTAFARIILAQPDKASMLAEIGGANLSALAGLTGSTDKVPYFTGAGSMSMASFTAYARTLVACADAVTARGVLGAVSRGGDTMTGALTLAADPSGALDAATKQYVDNLASGLKPKASVRAASTANVNIASAPASLDGITGVAGNRWLLKNQTLPAQNGIYVFAATGSALVRAADYDAWSEIPGSMMLVEEGTANADSGWVCTADQGGTLGTTAIAFSQFFGTGLFQPSAANLTTLAALSSIANLSALAGLSGAADKMAYFTGAGAMALATVTSAARTFLTAVDAAAQRTALGLGSAALLTAGVAANNAVQLDGSSRLPAVDGSLLTNLPSSASAGGQAYLTMAATSLSLNPENGNALFINGSNRVVPAAGVTLAATGLTMTGGIGGGRAYYIYAFMSGATMTLEASATAYAIDATTGVAIKSGDATRRLVGLWALSSAATWSLIATEGASWLNPREKSAVTGATNPSVTSTTMVFLGGALPQNFVTFANRNVRASVQSVMSQSVATATMALDLGLDASTSGSLANRIDIQEAATATRIFAQASVNKTYAEGWHQLTPIGFTSTGATQYSNLLTEVVIWG
jgi:hypothetical protein